MVTFNEEKQNKKVEELRKQEEEDLVKILSGKYGIDYIDLSQTSINTDALRLVPEATAKAAEVAAFQKVGKKLSLAVRSPESGKVAEALRHLEETGYTVTKFMVSHESLERAWARYADLSYASETKAGVLDISGEEIKKLSETLTSLEDIKKEVEDVLRLKKAYRISRILETILAGALSQGASDVHIEPEEERVRLRYRLDGVLSDLLYFDSETHSLLLSRIKLLSGLKLNTKESAQDGRFSVKIDENDIEIRSSVLPGAYGESVVLRILNPDTIALSMENLGVGPKLFEVLQHEISRPNGMILNTGPTGSGKTTTLYAFMRKIHTPNIKIITIEDPIEYHLPGVVQTQVDKKNYTFGSGLRSALRQDPDVIMVGEVRDSEVAETAINAALTGHLVFSTLHTNTAAGAFPRLIDLGINPKVISSSVNIVMAQRLVRKLCEHCKKEIPLEGEIKTTVDRILAGIVSKESIPSSYEHIWEPVGCPKCNEGYKGRIGIFEAIRMDDAIEKLVKESAGEHDIANAARAQGILSLSQDGVLKLLKGVTTFDELSRVLDLSLSTA